MSEEKSVNINGSISGIVNLGDNSINIKGKQENTNIQFEESYIEKPEITNDNNCEEVRQDKFGNKVVKVIVEVVIGVLVSVIAGCILYKLNMN